MSSFHPKNTSIFSIEVLFHIFNSFKMWVWFDAYFTTNLIEKVSSILSAHSITNLL